MAQKIRRSVVAVGEPRRAKRLAKRRANRTVCDQRIFPSKPGGCKFDPALLKSLSPAGSDADVERCQFWTKYEEIASEFDQRFVDRLENGVDISMLFAGLFSAVNTAFIIAIQSNIVVLNSSNATVANIVDAGGLVLSLAWTSALSYASLSTSLLAAFGALLAKQWLAHFKATRSTHGSLSSRGVHRQRKFDAIQNSHFNTILDCIPILLQASLLLFSISLLGNTWYPYRDVASVVLAATGIGFTLYLVTFFAAMLSPDSPFQTLPSQLTQLFVKFLPRLPQLCSKFLSESPQLVLYCGAQLVHLPRYLRASNSNRKFIPLPIVTLSQEAAAVRWLLRISTNPVVVTAVAKMVPEVDWPVDFDVDEFAKPLFETFKGCFKVESNDSNAVSLYCSDTDRAYACSKALCHLYSEVLYGEPGPDSELRSILASVKLCLSSTKDLCSARKHGFAFICALISLLTGDSTPTTSISVPEGELSWVSHIIPAFLHSTKHGRQVWVDLGASIIPKFAPYESTPSKVIADYWVILALIIGMPINPEDLVKVDKSSVIDHIREEVCAFIEPGPPRRKTSVPKIPNMHVFALAFDLIFRVLGVERDREMITGGDLNRWIVDLYKRLTNGRDDWEVWKNNGCAIIKVMFRTVDLHSLIDECTLRRSSKHIRHVLKRFVESKDAEMVGLVLPLWLDTIPGCIDHLCVDAITLLLGCNNPRCCHIAFRLMTQALSFRYRRSWQDLLQTDENKSTHLFDMLLQPLRMVHTVPTSGSAEQDHESTTGAEDRFNTALGYLRVVSTMANIAFFHRHLLARGHLQQCIGIRSDTQVSEGAEAKETLLKEYPFLLLSVVASVGVCSNSSCIEAATHPSTTIVKDYPLEWQTIITALHYIGNASRDQLDADRITHIADYIELIRRPPHDVPMELRTTIAARIEQTDPSALDSALVRLVHVLDSTNSPSVSSEWPSTSTSASQSGAMSA